MNTNSSNYYNNEEKYYITTSKPYINNDNNNKSNPSQQNSSLTVNLPEDVPEHHDTISPMSQSGNGDLDEHSTTTLDVSFGGRERLFIVFLSCIAIMASALPVQIYYPSLVSIENEFNTTANMVNITVAVYKVVQAFSPTLWGALSDQWGRRPAYMITMIISAAGCAGIAVSPTIGALIGIRMVQGFGGMSIQTIGNGVISDISVPATRAGYSSFYDLGYKVCSVMGPVFGGIIAQYLSWRWSFWILVITTCFGFIMISLFLPETLRTLVGGYYNPTPLQWFKRKQDQKKNRSDLEIASQTPTVENSSIMAIKTRFRRIPDFRESYRYLRMPDFALIMLIEGLYFGSQGCFMIHMPYLFRDYYHLDEQKIGLCYLALTGGAVVGGLGAGQYLNYVFQRMAKKYDCDNANNKKKQKSTGQNNKIPLDFPIYHARLQAVWSNAIVAQAVTIAYGWSFTLNTNIAVPLVIQFIVSFNVQCMNSATRCLLTDLRPDKGASVAASAGLFRQLFGAVGSLLMYPATKLVGPGWTYTILSGFLMLSNLIIPILMKYGNEWRTQRILKEEAKKEQKD
ncbi:major facilitator superfamily domain-containing protein [Circinella umbellata]|nr:major facilitator superfamily domain-containing protein [Circinella umbellata]